MSPDILVWVEGWTTYGQPMIDGQPQGGVVLIPPGPYAPVEVTGRTVEIEARGKGQTRHTQTHVLDLADVTVYERQR